MSLGLHESLQEKQLQNYINAYVDALSNKEKAVLFPETKNSVCEAGVYAIFENEQMVYVGETGNLKERMGDLRKTQNHSFRRTLGKKLYSHLSIFKPADSKTCFPHEIEMMLNEYMDEHLSIVILPTNFSRKEIEERTVVRHRATLYNSRGKRA